MFQSPPEPHRFHLAGAAYLRDALPASRLAPVVFRVERLVLKKNRDWWRISPFPIPDQQNHLEILHQ